MKNPSLTQPLFQMVLVLTWLSVQAVQLRAQNTEPPELVVRRTEYLAELQRETARLQSHYLRTLYVMREQFIRSENIKAVAAIEKEIAKMVSSAADSPAAAGPQNKNTLVIYSAVYRAKSDPKKAVDITEHLTKLYEEGNKTVVLNTQKGAGGKDPVYNRLKETVIIYKVKDKANQKVFPENYVLDFEEDLD